MYRRPKFLEILLEIRQEMSREADYDVDLFAEMVRSGKFIENKNYYDVSAEKTGGKAQNSQTDASLGYSSQP